MEQPEILAGVDKDRLRKWLSNMVIPWIVKTSFFVQMGFPETFVRQYSRKHRDATKLNGERVKAVRGVSEIDFLRGLTEAIGAKTSKVNENLSGCNRIRSTAEACLSLLDRIDGGK